MKQPGNLLVQAENRLEEIHQIEFFEGDDFSHPIRFDNEGRFLVVQKGKQPALLNLESRKIVPFCENDVLLDFDDVAFSPDGKWLAVCGIDDSIILFRLSPNPSVEIVEVARFPVATELTWVAFSSDSKKLISADPDQLVYHWDLPGIRRRLSEWKLDWRD